MNKLPWILLGVAITTIPTAIATTVMLSDISEDNWYYSAVQNLQELGVIEGYEDGTYQAENDVNRAEIAVMLDRLTDTINNGCLYIYDESHGFERQAEDGFYLDGYTIEEGTWCEDGYIRSIWE